MKKYAVNYYRSNDSSNPVAEFDTLEEAKAYCDKQTEGAEPFDGDDGDRAHYYHYEVYDQTLVTEEDFSETLYQTPDFWER